MTHDVAAVIAVSAQGSWRATLRKMKLVVRTSTRRAQVSVVPRPSGLAATWTRITPGANAPSTNASSAPPARCLSHARPLRLKRGISNSQASNRSGQASGRGPARVWMTSARTSAGTASRSFPMSSRVADTTVGGAATRVATMTSGRGCGRAALGNSTRSVSAVSPGSSSAPSRVLVGWDSPISLAREVPEQARVSNETSAGSGTTNRERWRGILALPLIRRTRMLIVAALPLAAEAR